MSVKEFLLTCDKLNIAKIAIAMYPTNASAASYLKNKLNGTNGRSFTEKDAFKAIRILHSLAAEIKNITL
ncbi:hypothetical protein [Pedobacter endophyticus]|uniref:Uncharacterized protein n=1 Tax=Pedobacter endophyticus TaxID=2789740 RepID=A0A7S9L138_9SPHI|nr:hypothetical protein [Pedobacter endophyticus]QPH40546.1 hypothetical protein IZT61_04495 [Pedobacter endophyticus]